MQSQTNRSQSSELTNQTRVGEEAVCIVLLQAAWQRAGLRLAVDKEVSESWPKTHIDQKLFCDYSSSR